ncbi:hypothetical protein JD844_009157 [Phrynosoma platyrhinos]|uniref:Putative WW-binding domain-containing protein n=1 Tax=Phrynosoma platyrhinos TaxID=52577 RepID=A0ABQ7TET4_PHRPL|nr:hypothetical protein JD844_009157 [Phrynosoma platyrhinos]
MEPREEEGGGGGRRSNNDGDREEAAVNGKRPSAAEESPKEKGQGPLGALLKPLPLAGAGEAVSPGSPTQEPPEEENEDDVWHYNSFQYWRSPLPTIHLSDILDLENNRAVDERESSSIGISEMET